MKCGSGRRTAWSTSGPRRGRVRASRRISVMPTPICCVIVRRATWVPALVLPFANAGAMQHHLNEISRRVTVGAHAVLTLDKAGWHTTRKLHVPANISLLHLAACDQPGAEPDREHLAVSAPKLSLKSCSATTTLLSRRPAQLGTSSLPSTVASPPSVHEAGLPSVKVREGWYQPPAPPWRPQAPLRALPARLRSRRPA